MEASDFKHIVILTGAGISAESGLGTFRDEDGLWTKYDLEEVATPEGFARNPAFVHEFYNARRVNLREAEPNAAHRALAELEREHSGAVLVVTQNIDDLHERAGSESVVHMHGEMFKGRCMACEAVVEWRGDMGLDSECGACRALGSMRPHVVWFREMPFEMERIAIELARCDLFISIGTSGNVYPAAGFVQEVRGYGRAHTLELNLEPSEGHSLFAEQHYGPATQVVPAYVAKLLGRDGG
jgi:NAD-dependent deacetylase